MLSCEEYAKRTDEAIVRQWVRDNRNNLAWEHAGVDFAELSPNFMENQDTLKKIIADELGEQTFKEWASRIEDKQMTKNLGLEKCWFCKTMIADPIDSNAIGGHLCAGCMRWWEYANVPASSCDDESEECHPTMTTDVIRGHEKMRQTIAESWSAYCDRKYRERMEAEDKREAERAEKRLKHIPVQYVPSDPDNEYDTRALWELEERERSYRNGRTY